MFLSVCHRNRIRRNASAVSYTHLDVYKRQEKEWDTGETVSGPGSTISYTEDLREALPLLLQKLQVRSLLDAPCGDYNWMSQTKMKGIEYTGGDVVPELIEKNSIKYPGVHFIVADITRDSLPKTDAVLCRDCFIPVSYTHLGIVSGESLVKKHPDIPDWPCAVITF